MLQIHVPFPPQDCLELKFSICQMKTLCKAKTFHSLMTCMARWGISKLSSLVESFSLKKKKKKIAATTPLPTPPQSQLKALSTQYKLIAELFLCKMCCTEPVFWTVVHFARHVCMYVCGGVCFPPDCVCRSQLLAQWVDQKNEKIAPFSVHHCQHEHHHHHCHCYCFSAIIVVKSLLSSSFYST